MKDFKKNLILPALLVILAGSAFAIRMSPASFTAQNVPIGKEFDLGVPLVIYLGEENSETTYFSAVPLLPSEVRETWLDGYEEIPDANYLIVSGEQPIAVLPESAAVRQLFVHFPEDSTLLNRRFLVQLRVMPVNSPAMFQAVLVGSYLIETSPSEDKSVRPGGGPLCVSPSTVFLDIEGEAVARIYNNDTVSHKFKTTFSAPPSDERRLAIQLSPGYDRGDPLKFEIDKASGTINANSFIDVNLRIKNKDYFKSLKVNTEMILWVEDPAMHCCRRFFRIHYRPK